jgi:hypothetical protein
VVLSFLLESHIRSKFAAGSPQQQKHSLDRFKHCSFSTPEMPCELFWVGDVVCQNGTFTRIGEWKKGIYLYFLGSPVSKSTLAGWWWLEPWNFICPYIGNNHPNGRTHIFQRGWNHQPEHIYIIYIYVYILCIYIYIYDSHHWKKVMFHGTYKMITPYIRKKNTTRMGW